MQVRKQCFYRCTASSMQYNFPVNRCVGGTVLRGFESPKKLEDAEKKAKGGSGFFSGLFGNAKAEEAADLFVQEDSDTVLVCEENGCGMSFGDIATFEDHYERFHRHQCAICGQQFPNIHCLEIHADENHCSIFKTERDRNPSIALFRCYEASCSQIYANPEERNFHSEEMHGIRDPSVSVERRKLPRKEFVVSRMNQVSTSCTLHPRIPRVIIFGNEQKEPAFEARRMKVFTGAMNNKRYKENYCCQTGAKIKNYMLDIPLQNAKEAGNLFKISKLWREAGDAFVRSAEIHAAATDRKHDAASNFAEAANCYRKVNPQQAIDCLVKTAETYTDMGRFNMAAKYHCTMAEIFESEAPDVTQAMAHYQEAADFYKGEESRSSATKCMIKVAQYAAQLEDYKRAIKIFEEVATWEADHPTLKYAAKNHFFQALLCYLCSDLLDTQNALKRYEEISPSFVDSREYKLVNELISCLEDKNQVKFTELVKSFDKISRLDQWHTSLLVKIKRSYGDEDDDDLKSLKYANDRISTPENDCQGIELSISSSPIARDVIDFLEIVFWLHCEPSKYMQQEKASDISLIHNLVTLLWMDTLRVLNVLAYSPIASLTASPSFISKFVEKIRSGECYEFATTKFHNGLLVRRYKR
ncbi:Alpha-soluble NSF attachment protein [Dirofilaria immitis]|nr:Alpha-soluble NSF attachment protein [Dirofilaria immitis]